MKNFVKSLILIIFFGSCISAAESPNNKCSEQIHNTLRKLRLSQNEVKILNSENCDPSGPYGFTLKTIKKVKLLGLDVSTDVNIAIEDGNVSALSKTADISPVVEMKDLSCRFVEFRRNPNIICGCYIDKPINLKSFEIPSGLYVYFSESLEPIMIKSYNENTTVAGTKMKKRSDYKIIKNKIKEMPESEYVECSWD